MNINVERGIDILQKDFIQKCTKCGGSGFLENSLCACMKRFQTGVKLMLGEFPLDLIRLDKPVYEDKVLIFYQNNPDKVLENGLSVYVHGPLGVGKTLCSVWLAEGFVSAYSPEGKCGYRHDLTVQFMEASQFVLRSRISGGDDQELKKFYKTFDASLFVLDDFNNEYKSAQNPQYVHRLYEMFLRHRISNCLPTIITTNVPPQQVSTEYDAKIASLLGIKQDKNKKYYMAGRFLEIRLDGPDYRKLSNDRAWSEYFEEE